MWTIFLLCLIVNSRRCGPMDAMKLEEVNLVNEIENLNVLAIRNICFTVLTSNVEYIYFSF